MNLTNESPEPTPPSPRPWKKSCISSSERPTSGTWAVMDGREGNTACATFGLGAELEHKERAQHAHHGVEPEHTVLVEPADHAVQRNKC